MRYQRDRFSSNRSLPVGTGDRFMHFFAPNEGVIELEHCFATSDGYDSESKARKVHRGVKGLMNEIFLDDLRERVHRGLYGQAQKGYWCGGRPYGFKLKPIVDPTQRDAYGQPARIGTVLEIDGEAMA